MSDRPSKRWVWNPHWASPYESAYTLLHKFAWANDANSPHIWRALFQKSNSGGLITPRSLIAGTWMGPPWDDIEPQHLMREAIALPTLSKWIRHLASERHLRFCPVCLTECYHSVIFQIDGLSQCPIHNEALRTHCVACGKVTDSFHIHSDTLRQPFRCRYCIQPIAGAFDPNSFYSEPETLRARAEGLEPIVKWLEYLHRMVANYSMTEDAPVPHLRAMDGKPSEQLVNFAIARRLVPLTLKGAASVRQSHGLQFNTFRRCKLREQQFRYVDIDSIPAIIQSTRRSICKSIRRYLSRTYLRRHQDCVSQARSRIDTIYHGVGDFQILLTTDLCPIAQAYARWWLVYQTDGYFSASWGNGRELRCLVNRLQAMDRFDQNTGKGEDLRSFAWKVLLHFHNEAAAVTEFERYMDCFCVDPSKSDYKYFSLLYRSLGTYDTPSKCGQYEQQLPEAAEVTMTIVGASAVFAKQLSSVDRSECKKWLRASHDYEYAEMLGAARAKKAQRWLAKRATASRFAQAPPKPRGLRRGALSDKDAVAW